MNAPLCIYKVNLHKSVLGKSKTCLTENVNRITVCVRLCNCNDWLRVSLYFANNSVCFCCLSIGLAHICRLAASWWGATPAPLCVVQSTSSCQSAVRCVRLRSTLRCICMDDQNNKKKLKKKRKILNKNQMSFTNGSNAETSPQLSVGQTVVKYYKL